MIDEIQALIEEYHRFLKDNTALREVGDWVEITTPFLDRHNDCVQIYVRRENGHFLLTDDSYTIHDLRSSGCELETSKRKSLLQMTLNGFGVNLDGEALVIQATTENFALRKHSLTQAMLAVGDMFYLAEPITTSLFLEDVAAWLDENGVRFSERIPFVGKTGYSHHFDFVIPRSRNAPERLVKALNRPDKTNIEIAAFSWIDVRDVRPEGTRMFSVLNDAERPVPESMGNALQSYDVHPVVWSQRDRAIEELVA